MELNDVMEAVRTLEKLRTEETALSEALKEKSAAVRRMSEEVIPAMLNELGVSSLELTSGAVVSTKMQLSASIPKSEKALAAYEWLERNGCSDIIKSSVTLDFGREHAIEAQGLAERLGAEYGSVAAVTLSDKVHPSTLKATLKELLKQGVDVPVDLFNVREYYVTTIKETTHE